MRKTNVLTQSDFLPVSRPSISEEDISAVGNVMRSGWLTTGKQAAMFEKKFSEYVGCVGAVAMNSATAGMHLSLVALGIGPGDEVVTPSMTWVSTVNLIVLSGARPVFADVDRDTLMISSDTIREKLTRQTRLIIPVHFAGAPAEMRPIRKLALEKRIPIIEDAAHALGTEYMGQKVGRNDTSIFSFHPIKNITTGEGGMFCSNDPELLDRIRRLKFHGLGADAADRLSQGRAPLAQVTVPGFKYNMPDISAALGITQLERLDRFNQKRTELALHYRAGLSDIDEILPLTDPSYAMKHSWHLFVVRLDTERSGMSREAFMEKLKRRNVGAGIHFLAVHLHDFYRKSLGIRRGILPNTEWNSDRVLSLPLFPEMGMKDVDRVIRSIKEVLIHG